MSLADLVTALLAVLPVWADLARRMAKYDRIHAEHDARIDAHDKALGIDTRPKPKGAA